MNAPSAHPMTGYPLAEALAMATKQMPGRQPFTVEVNGELVGDFGPTTSTHPGLAWSWRVFSTWGDARDREHAVEQIKAAVLRFWPIEMECRRKDAERRAAYDAELAALPERLRPLRERIERLRFAVEIERHKSVFNAADLGWVEQQLRDAEMAFAVAERTMAEAA